MNVLHVISEMGTGGAESLVAELVRGGRERNWISAVATAGGVQEDRLVREGLATAYRVPRAGRRPLGMARAVVATRRAVRAFRPDVVISHNVGASVVTRLATAGGRSPHRITVFHGLAEGDYPRAAWLLDRSGSTLVAVSEAISGRLAAAGLRQPVQVIPNAVTHTPGAPRSVVRARLALDQHVPVALCAARLVVQKRHDILLEAWASLRQDAVLLVAGDGPQRSALEAQAEALGLGENVRLLGDRTDVPDLLAAADVAVLSSDWEGLPMFVLEAMAAGVPVVATNVDGLHETLGEGGGLLVPSARSDALAAALGRLLGDPVARAEAGARARAVIAARHSPDLLLSRYEELIHEAMPAARRRNR